MIQRLNHHLHLPLSPPASATLCLSLLLAFSCSPLSLFLSLLPLSLSLKLALYLILPFSCSLFVRPLSPALPPLSCPPALLPSLIGPVKVKRPTPQGQSSQTQVQRTTMQGSVRSVRGALASRRRAQPNSYISRKLQRGASRKKREDRESLNRGEPDSRGHATLFGIYFV